MPEIHNTDQMQASVKDILAYLSRELPDAIQNMAAPRFVACDFEEKTLELAFEIQPWMRNPANILHGGLTAMMLDTTMGTLSRCYVRGEGITPTITMEVSYLLPIPIGSTLHVRAHASHTGHAVNNLTDSGSSVVTLIGFKMASKPADEKHPFGHARIEYLSGVIVSFIVIFLGLQLGMSSIEKILTPEENALTPVALVVLVISILAKLWQCLFYRKVGRMIKSESVEATSKDSRNDVIATSVVLLGAVITMLTGVNLDGYMGAAVALFIVFSGVQLTISTADPLLGQAPEGELVQTITEKMLSYPGIIGMHDLAVHNYGVGRCFASAHCEVDAKNDILVSHDLIDNIERDFSRDLGIHMVIHLDPVIVGDARTDALHCKVQSLVTALYPTVTIHDFRVIWGVTHSNIVFDAAVPFSVKDSDAVITQKLEAEIQKLDPDYRTVVTIDRR